MIQKNTTLFAQTAVIAALYVTLTYLFAPISFGEIQVRISEALTILPLFTPAAVFGLFIGCIVGNILGGAVLLDIIFGSLATLTAAFLTYKLRNQKPFLAILPPILVNTAAVPLILKFGYGAALPLPLMAATVGIGEALSCGVLGMLLLQTLNRYKNVLFR